MAINSKSITFAVMFSLMVLHTPFANAGFFDDLKNAVADGLDTSKRNLQTYQGVTDKQLVDAFYYISANGEEQTVQKDIYEKRKYKFIKLTSDSLHISDYFKKNSMYAIREQMQTYSFSPLDVFGVKYVALAKSRGNLVNQYKPKLGGVLNDMLEQNFAYKPAPNVATWTDVDNVLAEYTPNGELVSFMTRSHQAIDQIGATSDQYIHFFFGKNLMQIVENRVSKRLLDDSFQRTVSDQTQFATASGSHPPAASVATPAATQPASSATGATSPEKRLQLLQQLADMRKSGALTDDEFIKEKAKILAN